MRLRVENGSLCVDLSFWEKVWSLHGSFVIPMTHVKELTHGIPQSLWWELRMPGSFVPGVIKAGTFLGKRGKEFWYVTRWGKTQVTIELQHEKYKRLVLALPMGELIPMQLQTLRNRVLIATSH